MLYLIVSLSTRFDPDPGGEFFHIHPDKTHHVVAGAKPKKNFAQAYRNEFCRQKGVFHSLRVWSENK